MLAKKKAISVKWVYKLILSPSGKMVKYKTRLVARGFLQKKRIDFEEVFPSLARIETIREVVALASSRDLKMH